MPLLNYYRPRDIFAKVTLIGAPSEGFFYNAS